MSSKCDKCGGDVLQNNDASIFDAVRTGNPIYLLAFSRHLLPVIENDEVICSGSPSRAQYVEGQPRDTRDAYRYIPEQEPEMRATYAALQQLDLIES